jgi:hypothetical protein
MVNMLVTGEGRMVTTVTLMIKDHGKYIKRRKEHGNMRYSYNNGS